MAVYKLGGQRTMSNLEKLQSLKVTELREICKSNGIQHSTKNHKFTKGEMIEAILKAGVFEEESVKVDESAKVEEKVASTVKDNSANRIGYLERIEAGTIVAFKLKSGKVISAKVIKKSTSRQKLMVETNYGQEYKIDWADVIWVKTGKRWPRGIYEMFKKDVGENNDKAE